MRLGLRRALFACGAAVPALALVPVFAAPARTAARNDAAVEISAPTWSPKRAELAFTATFDEHAVCGVDSGRDPGAPPKRDVFIVNADGSALRRLAPSAPYDAREGPAWAPNGTRLSTTLWTSSTRVDRNVQVVTRTGDVDYTEIFAEPAGWAPDSQHLGINRFDPTDSPTDTVIRNLRTGDVWRLGRYGFGAPHWSPHGNLIAYASNGFIYTVRTNRTGRRRVMPAADVFALQWSGDGTLLGYQGSSRLGYGPVYVVAPDGRHRRRITRGDTSWSWSPRGRVLALNRQLIDFATGRRWRVLPSRITHVLTAVWSPNGRRLAYVVPAGMYVVGMNGRGGHLIRWPADQPTSDPAWSYDSHTLAFATHRGLYEVSAEGRKRGYVPLDWCKAA
jgi:Tol biopolymer transport system component